MSWTLSVLPAFIQQINILFLKDSGLTNKKGSSQPPYQCPKQRGHKEWDPRVPSPIWVNLSSGPGKGKLMWVPVISHRGNRAIALSLKKTTFKKAKNQACYQKCCEGAIKYPQLCIRKCERKNILHISIIWKLKCLIGIILITYNITCFSVLCQAS